MRLLWWDKGTVNDSWDQYLAKDKDTTSTTISFQAMRKHWRCNPSWRQLRNNWQLSLAKTKYSIHCFLWLCQVPRLEGTTAVGNATNSFTKFKIFNQPYTFMQTQGLVFDKKKKKLSPENNGSRWVCNQRFSQNRIKIEGVSHIVTWSPTSIAIAKGVTTLVILRTLCSCCLENWRTNRIWTSNRASSQGTRRIKEMELDLKWIWKRERIISPSHFSNADLTTNYIK